MPGKAFTANLGQAAFPLIPTQTHQQLKASLGDKLHSFYAHVGSPAPATDKREHGDVELGRERDGGTRADLVVCTGDAHLATMRGQAHTDSTHNCCRRTLVVRYRSWR